MKNCKTRCVCALILFWAACLVVAPLASGQNKYELGPIEWTGKSFNYAAICSSFL